MKKFLFFIAIVISGLLQVTILNYFKIFNIKPDLLLICAVIASLTFELKWALTFSLFSGLLKDVFAINSFGINSALFILWSFLIVRLNREISLESNVLRAGLVFIITFLHSIISGLIYTYSGRFVPLGILLRIIIIQSVYTALVLPIVYKFIKPIYSIK